METSQFVVYFILLLIILLQVRKYFDKKSLTNLSAAEVKRMMKEKGNIVLLDVRTLSERKAGAIKPSIHIPLHEISASTDQLKKYQTHEIICYCQSGSRSVSAAIRLKKLGFTASNLTGGYSAW